MATRKDEFHNRAYAYAAGRVKSEACITVIDALAWSWQAGYKAALSTVRVADKAGGTPYECLNNIRVVLRPIR